ncbi:MAG TPA: LacI family DNA-binding transcriptional regulator, partial [Roseiflexaceae bacterium]|nr:LacI family DNA-binding transcriptional regulator [Roseiflexaceae bacterium]
MATSHTTIKQVAERAGVSTATVSYVLNGTGTVTDETRRRVLSVVAELNYQPRYAAQSLRGRSQTLGIPLMAAPERLADPVFAEVLAGFSDAAAQRGYYLLLAPVEPDADDVEVCLNLARSGRVDGLVLLDMRVDDPRALALCQAGEPHVCAGPPPAGCHSPAVVVDTEAAAAQATTHLIGRGHHRIALIQLPSELAESEPRYLGYAAALAAGGILVSPELIVEAGRTEEHGYHAMQELLAAAEPPTAVLACSDELAFGALHALYDAGFEGGRDVSLSGFD